MKGNKEKSTGKKHSVRYLVLATVCIVGLLIIQAIYMIASYIPEMQDTDVDAVYTDIESKLDGYASDVAGESSEKIASCKILSDIDKDSFKTKLNSSISDNISIEYKIGDIDRKNKSTVVTFEVRSLNLDGYSDKVIDSVKNDVSNFLKSDILDDISSIFEDIISGENSDDVDVSDIVSEIPENESELNTNKYLEEPLNSDEAFGTESITCDVKFTYNYDTRAWEVSTDDVNNLVKQSEDLISSGVTGEIDKLVEYADKLSVLDTVDIDEYTSILNGVINKKLDTLKDSDYTSYIQKYLEKYMGDTSNVQ